MIKFWRAQLPPPADGAAADAPAGTGPAASATPQIGANVPMPDWLQEAESTGEGEADDDLLQQAISLVKKHRYASTSMLQRRLRIGYNRAARIVEQMEEMGIVGPADGSRSREVLVSPDEAGAEASE